jgi:hypothetical protein
MLAIRQVVSVSIKSLKNRIGKLFWFVQCIDNKVGGLVAQKSIFFFNGIKLRKSAHKNNCLAIIIFDSTNKS